MTYIPNGSDDAATLSTRVQDVLDKNAPEKDERTGLADGTDYFYYDTNYADKFLTQLDYDGGTAGVIVFTVEGTGQDDGTAEASTGYDDYTLEFGAVSFTTVAGAVGTLTLNDYLGALSLCRYVRIKYVITGSSSDVDITAHHRRVNR